MLVYDRKRLVALLMLAFVLSCSGPRTYLHPSADFHFIKKVAVLPFENYSNDRFAGNKLQEWTSTEILRRKYLEVVDFGEVQRVFLEEGVPKISFPDATTLKSAGERLGVQAFIAGTVEEYGTMQRSSAPIVSITIRLLDAQSAQILWQGSYSKIGANMFSDLLGLTQKDTSHVAQNVVSRLVDTIFK